MVQGQSIYMYTSNLKFTVITPDQVNYFMLPVQELKLRRVSIKYQGPTTDM